MSTNYNNYYKDHYKSKFDESDIIEWTKWFDVQWRLINQKVRIKKTASVLEIGPGFGGLYQLLSEMGVKDYTGLDLDPDIVAFTNKYFKTKAFRFQSVEDLPLKKKYDYIFAFEVLEHIENPSAVSEKIHALLKPGGVFIGTTPYPYKRNIVSDETHISVLHPDNWKRLFNLAGFKKVETHPMTFAPFFWRLHKRANIRIPAFLPIKNFVSTCLIIAKK
jgi:2-polyprenyl-3-methyl-5-hydroxy-6-metoxy-1,4-benzoquinol methylase